MKTPSDWTQCGFTLLELSIVLVLIAVILGGGLAIFTSSMQASQYNKTVERIDAIEKALLNYAVANNRIPCPSNLTLTATGSTNYGMEAGASAGGMGTGECVTGMTPAANFKAASGTVEGGVPTRALQLPDDFMYDGWGRRFRYAVDPAATKIGVFPYPVAGLCGQSFSAITVYDATGAARTTNGLYALISHGANGHGGYTSNGVAVNAGSVNADEQTNCHCDSTGAYGGTYTPLYVEKVPMQNAGNALDSFDDIVTFKEGWQMQAQNFPLTYTAPCTYAYVRSITIDHTKVGTVNNTDQANFPVLVAGTYNGAGGTFDARTAGNGGPIQNTVSLNGQTVPADLAFTSDSTCTSKLNWEIASYTPSTGQIEAWVNVPTVSHSTDTVIYMCYDYAGATAYQSTATSAWDSNYKAVWHLPNGTTLAGNDSTIGASNLTNTGTAATAGKINGGAGYAGYGSGDVLTTHAAPAPTYPFTYEAWVKLATTAIPSGGGTNAEWLIMTQQGNGDYIWEEYINVWGTPMLRTVACTSSCASDYFVGYTIPTLDTNWHHIVAIFTGANTQALYFDGAAAVPFWIYGGGSTPTAPTDTYIGTQGPGGTDAFNGTIDEVRISNIARSADWVVTEYNNQNIPDKASGTPGFYTVGAAGAPH